MRTEPATAISALPVLVDATPADQDGVVATDNFLPLRPVRRIRDSEISQGSVLRNFRNAEKQEFMAFAKMVHIYKRQREHPYRNGEYQEAWNAAVEAFEQFLVGRKQSSPLLEDTEKRAEFGRQVKEIIAPACGVDLRNESPEEAADLLEGYRLGRDLKFDPRSLLCYIISRHLDGAKLVLWSRREGSQPAIYCKNKRAAFYIEALFSLDDRKGWAICQYSRCGEIFFQRKLGAKCCSPKHANNHRMEEYRKTTKGRRAMKRDAERRKKRNALARQTNRRLRPRRLRPTQEKSGPRKKKNLRKAW